MKTASNLDLRQIPSEENSTCLLLCPVCGEATTHLSRVLTEQEAFGVLVTQEDAKRIPTDSRSRHGSLVKIDFYCESGHCFTLRFEFHQGSICVTCPVGEEFDPSTESPDELWRD